MKYQNGVAWLPIIVISAVVVVSALTAYLSATQETKTVNVNSSLNANNASRSNSNVYSNQNTNASRVNSANQTEGYFPPVNNDPNANTNLANISPQTNANSTSRKSCNVDADCGLLICSGCFSNEYLKTAPPDLACRTYEGYRCACVAGQCQETK